MRFFTSRLLIFCALAVTLPAATFIAIASSARGGAVTGRVTLSNGKPAGNAVVFLQGDVKPSPSKNAIVDQRDRKFVPHVSVVTVGTKIQFPNNDSVFHNVFTEYHASRFDLGMYPKGTSKYQVFDRAGVAVLMCTVHPSMSAYVVVVDTPYFAKADSRGNFSIPSVPSGSYQAQVWLESGEKLTQQITINPGAILELKTHR